MMQKTNQKIIMGIETSCDDTAVAIINSNKEILSNVVINQNSNLSKYGGIVPEVAARDHLTNIEYAVKEALIASKLKINDINLISATGGPGLIGGVIVGTVFGKSLAMSLDVPYIAVNHLEGHALTARLTNNIKYPYLLLLVSGGHTQIIAVLKYGKYIRLSSTLDDAAGETFDKAAKILNIGFPGGPQIEKMAEGGDPNSFKLPRPMYKSKNPNFSFSGLKTSFSQTVLRNQLTSTLIQDLSASLQKTISDCLVDRTKIALINFQKIINSNSNIQLVVAGGVASNKYIRHELEKLASASNANFIAPPIHLCTDNGAMIAWAGYEKYNFEGETDLNFQPRPRWPLDPDAHSNNPIFKTVGKKGVKA
jgi:N6-L-threonylcarbamoyladenine synthase